MEQQALEQAVQNLQREMADKSQRTARKDAIDDYIENLDYNTPAQCMTDLLRLLKDRYIYNVDGWRIVIRTMGSAYAQAYNSFNTIVQIRDMAIEARRQMVANILGVFAGAGFCWIAPMLEQWKRIDRVVSTKGAKSFFTNGFQEVIKQSATWITTKMTEISFDRCLPDLSHVLETPLEFQNRIMNAFESCRNLVVGQFIDLIENPNSINPIFFLSVRKIIAKQKYDWDNSKFSKNEIFEKIEHIFDEPRQIVKNMNEHCIKESIYFRERPEFDDTPGFKTTMAKRFERAMWAAWIPSALKRKKWIQMPVSRTFKAAQPWLLENFQKEILQGLAPGYYYLDTPDFVIRVYETYEKPGSTLEDRLAYLHVIKSKKYPPIHVPIETLKQLENFGRLTSKAEIAQLIAWAKREHLNPYGWDQTRFKERDRSELIIHPLA